MKILKDEHKLSKGELFGRKGIIVTELKKIEYDKNDTEFSPVKFSNERKAVKRGNKIIVTETAKIFLNGDVLLSSISNIAKNVGTIEKNIELAKKNIEEWQEQLKTLDKLGHQYEKWRDYATKLSREEFKQKKAKAKAR